MKKFLSAAAAVAVGAASLTATVNAAETKTASGTEGTLVVLGDSIASGYNNAETVEYNYGTLVGDYLNYDVKNFAKEGKTSTELYEDLAYINDIDAWVEVQYADTIVISIGGNDLIAAAKEMIPEYCDTYALLAEGYTAADVEALINSKPTSEFGMTDLKAAMDMIDKTKLNSLTASQMLNEALTDLIGGYNPGGVVYDTIIPNTKDVIKEINTLNPNAEIVIQTVYQPLQLSDEFIAQYFGEGAKYEKYASYVDLARQQLMEKVMASYADGLYITQRDLAAEGIDVVVADVYAEFTALELTEGRDHWKSTNAAAPNTAEAYFADLSSTNRGNTYFFTSTETKKDFHPNQAGHIAIAGTILEQLGNLHDADSSSLMRVAYDSVDKEFPGTALETYNTVVGTLTDIPTEPVPDYITALEYDNSPMTVGETREIRFYHPETLTAAMADISEVSSNITYTYEEGSDTIYITATAAGTAKMYVREADCAFGAYVTIEVNEAATTTTTTTVTETTTTTTTEPATETTTTTSEEVVETTTTPEEVVETTTTTTTESVEVPTTEPTTTEPVADFLLGDANLDEFIDSSDASMVLAAYALVATGGETPLNETQQLAADVNTDDAIDASDASTILSYYAYIATGGELSLPDFMAQ